MATTDRQQLIGRIPPPACSGRAGDGLPARCIIAAAGRDGRRPPPGRPRIGLPRSLSPIVLSLLLLAGGAATAAPASGAATSHVWTCLDKAGHRTIQDHACGEGVGSREAADAAQGRAASRPPVVAEGRQPPRLTPGAAPAAPSP